MTKRRSDGRKAGRYNLDDNPIDIDGAFAPTKGAQSVEYDVDDDRIGLTQAFGAIVPDEEPAYGWNDTQKWKGFDWNASVGDDADGAEQGDEPADEPTGEPEGAEETDGQPAVDQPADGESAGQAAEAAPTAAAPATSARPSSGRGRHAAPDSGDSPRMQKSRRMRKTLIVLIILLLIGLGALGYFGFRTITESQQQAIQQTQEQAASSKDAIDSQVADDATAATTKHADVPDLSLILGKTQDEAIKALQRGATVTATREATEEDSVIKTNVTVSLTSEPSDSRTGGTPTVYLGLNEAGTVVQAGYSASASALGFGTLSFADAVTNERVIEKTLQKIGVDVPDNVVVLPDNKDEYSTYASDGTTVVKERCSFEGDANVNGTPCLWSAVLSYDYTTQVLTGNLTDTVRVIYVYVTQSA